MKTAVEWMVEKLFKPMDSPPIENVSDIIEQAKELEKQQIIEFAEWCLSFVEYCETAKSIRYYNYLHGTELYTNLQLLEIFKKEKGL